MRNATIIAVLLSGLTLAQAAAWQKNSTSKQRIQPGDYSGRCGSAILWRESVEQAITESARSGKPVFWYVPTLKGSFMDRTPVVDRYMLAGPFSWPSVIQLINDHFIPVRAVADGELQKKYEVQPYKFVEPGFVVIDPNGDRVAAVDQITTFSPDWFESLVRHWADAGPAPSDPEAGQLGAAWAAFRAGQYRFDDSTIEAGPADLAEMILLQGMFAFRRGDHARARQIWMSARQMQPDHPLAWKAAAEAENWGPFVRGFEIHRRLPAAAMEAGVRSRGSAAPPNTWDEQQLRERSVEFLLGMQSREGGWFDSDYDFGGTDSLPNVHVAVTALAGIALLDVLPRMEQRRESLLDAIWRAADFVSDNTHVNYADRDEILWAHAYRVRFLSRLVQYDERNRIRYRSALQRAVADLQSIQTRTGSWYHEYANPFVTATALTALKIAAEAGANVDDEKIRLGLTSLARDRFDNGAFPYYQSRPSEVRPAGKAGEAGQIASSAGRMPICELALWRWDKSDHVRLQAAMTAAFDHHGHLAVSYKYDNHTSRMGYGGFFFWYDMRSRAEALSYMNPGPQRDSFVQQHRQLVLALPELDGCFVDSHELGRVYGTAMALQTLELLDRTAGNRF